MTRNICWFLQVSVFNKTEYWIIQGLDFIIKILSLSWMQFTTGSSLVWRDRLDMACDMFIAAPHSAWAIHLSLLPKLSILRSVTPQLPCQQYPNLPAVKLIWVWCVLKPEQWIVCGLQVYKEYLVSKAST